MLFKRLLFLVLLVYIFFINIHVFNLMGEDKRSAENHKWRISEKELIVKAAIGGAIGEGIGMLYFWHKVRKPKFYFGVPLLIVFNFLIFRILSKKILKRRNDF